MILNDHTKAVNSIMILNTVYSECLLISCSDDGCVKIFDVNDLVAEELASLSDEELFTVIDHNDLESEKITAPRYSYWQSVFRVFFKKKINIFVLSVFAVLLLEEFLFSKIHTSHIRVSESCLYSKHFYSLCKPSII